MAYPFREDWIKKDLERQGQLGSEAALALGPIAWLAYVDTGRRSLELAALAAQEAYEVFRADEITVLTYLQMIEYTRELIYAHLRSTAQSGSVDQAGGEQDPAPS